MSAWQIAVGVFLIVLSLTYFGVVVPHLLLGVVAMLAGVLVIVGK